MSSLLIQFLFAALGTLGFAIIFNVPKRHIPAITIIGGAGWTIYQVALALGCSVPIACFFGAFTVGFLSESSARVFKETATVFIIPGVIPLVPGAGTYYTMLAVVNGNLGEAAATGTQTLMTAGCIALGLLISTAIFGIFHSVFKKTIKA